ncbi:MAG: MiaB/RimO family radical SAM methylthiotransferase [Chloroflexi bacterium]|nr:MAG: MiaB/RimO family radical SAM methylthiotransferase [Chloroflexota bacterium]MBL1197239.1 MiaB/RimO family radical SAM methylthiotransferase [Chloroflexota bacterium]NOH14532.1 MiaB/RimO family radical SAM methylthiotransferase [Chloroflexota bacterium]
MKVYLDTVGCRLNQSEIEKYALQFRAAGHSIVARMDEAEMLVLNTCAVTASAAADSRKKVRQASKAGIRDIVLTGCWSNLAPDEAAQMPHVNRVVPNAIKDELVPDLLGIQLDDFDLEPLAREPLPGSRQRTRAFIKVQDGCDNRCTFCVTTVAREEGRSQSMQEVVSDIRAALKGGAQEVVLTGVHLGSWGHDFPQPMHLRQLVVKILEVTDAPRVRLSSLEPWDLDADFFNLWEDPRLCRHLHLPLQSGSATTLRRMARNTTPNKFRALIEAARQAIPDVAITTDVIVGFPGETDAEFTESLAFVEEMDFAGAHVFTYSERPETAAAGMPNQVHNYTRKERNAAMQAVVAKSEAAYRSGFIGQEMSVLWESVDQLDDNNWQHTGLTDNYIKIQALHPEPLWNRITPTRLTATNGAGLYGHIQSTTNVSWFSN